jgi:hypothetical protein
MADLPLIEGWLAAVEPIEDVVTGQQLRTEVTTNQVARAPRDSRAASPSPPGAPAGWTVVLPDYLDGKVHGAPAVQVLYQEAGMKASGFDRVGGGT